MRPQFPKKTKKSKSLQQAHADVRAHTPARHTAETSRTAQRFPLFLVPLHTLACLAVGVALAELSLLRHRLPLADSQSTAKPSTIAHAAF